MADEMEIPTVHSNGTPGSRLLEDLNEAIEAMSEAILRVHDAAPNGRDFYVKGEVFARVAQSGHRGRMQRLEAVRTDLVTIRDGVLAQIEAAVRQKR